MGGDDHNMEDECTLPEYVRRNDGHDDDGKVRSVDNSTWWILVEWE